MGARRAAATGALAGELPGRAAAQSAAARRHGRLIVDKAADGSGYARAVFFVGLAAWAWQELIDGVNWLRRVLGAAGLVYVVVNVGAALETRAG